ncbi:toll/interleukin-1 receptor domain-containing protein [Roseibacillus persicicus]|uniref:toll/interleukin-1 receptor domain-containing protein n=1 Tax=Roseibacillus persicicus TaxID=454148 RepID=UPI00280F3FFC|nr:toll/interleukin-1 receptor domain-containing protein [Roseibacillus persicicus]MDQ8192656.1 toll/interleukin-1 receptor domain-containing protein [Roseibacillus persicicus]
MKVFLSWSGPRSRHVAESLRAWLPRVLQAVKPWMSEEDLSSGTRWSNEIAAELESTRAGIICVTPENQHNAWLVFEAGALSKTLSQTMVCPYLKDLAKDQLSGPISQFQGALADKEGTKRILLALNSALKEHSIGASEMDEIFDVWWPKLEGALAECPEVPGPKKVRSTDEILAEILENSREQLRREDLRVERSRGIDDKIGGLFEQMETHSNSMKGLGEEAKTLKKLFASRGADLSVFPDFDEQNMTKMLSGMRELQGINQDFTERLLSPPPQQGGTDEEELAPKA